MSIKPLSIWRKDAGIGGTLPEEGGTKAHTLVETFLLLPSRKEFVRLRTRGQTHTHNTHSTHARPLDLYLGLGVLLRQVVHAFPIYIKWWSLGSRKIQFKTADFRHFSLSHINFFLQVLHDELFSMFQNFTLLFLFFPSRSEILNCIECGLFINPLKGRQITLWQHNVLGEGSNWIFETKVKCFVDTKGQYQLRTTGASQLTTSGLTLAKLITFVHITQARKRSCGYVVVVDGKGTFFYCDILLTGLCLWCR